MKSERLFAILVVFCIITAAVFSAFAEETIQHNFVPANGYVPDEATAVRIAEAVWLPIYGKAIYDAKPFKAALKKDVWTVEGALPKTMPGGVPEIEIDKKTGRILRVSHGK